MVRIPTRRPPTHPGEMLLEEFLKPYEISQKMLSSTLRDLEENGFVIRTVVPVIPPQVEYELTDLGRDFLTPVYGLADWVVKNAPRIDAARASYAGKKAAE